MRTTSIHYPLPAPVKHPEVNIKLRRSFVKLLFDILPLRPGLCCQPPHHTSRQAWWNAVFRNKCWRLLVCSWAWVILEVTVRVLPRRSCSGVIGGNEAPKHRFFRMVSDHVVLELHHHHHHHLSSWIRSFELFRHRRVAIVSWGVRDPFFPGVCKWGRISGVWCCPFFRGGWSSFVCIWVSCLVFKRSLVLLLCFCFLFCPVLCIL